MSSTTAPETELRSMDRRSQDREARRVILSSYLGSTIEYYDFLLYASDSALVFPHVFFQDLDPVAGVIASYGTFAAGYLARPLGGAIFGHFGDKLGRKKMLILPMFVMGIGSTLIGLIPSSASIGSWGAILLILLCVFQGSRLPPVCTPTTTTPTRARAHPPCPGRCVRRWAGVVKF